MLSIFVCEDNREYRNQIVDVIDKYTFGHKLEMKIVCSTGSPDNITSYLEENKVAGLYFLDLDLGIEGFTGINLAQEIRKYDPRGFIVFITSDAESHQLTFKYKVEAMDYIVKGDVEIKERIHECINNAADKFLARSSPLQETIVIKSGGSLIPVELSKIIYIETDTSSRNIIIHTENSRHESRTTLKEFLKELDSRFVQCHRSIIVNKDKVVSIDKPNKTLTLVTGDRLEVSKLFLGNFKVN